MSAPIIAAEQCGPLWGRECEGSAPFSHTQIHTNVPLRWTKAAKEPHEGENVWLYFLFFYFLALWVIYGWLRAGWAGRPPRIESGSWNPSHVQSLRCALSAEDLRPQGKRNPTKHTVRRPPIRRSLHHPSDLSVSISLCLHAHTPKQAHKRCNHPQACCQTKNCYYLSLETRAHTHVPQPHIPNNKTQSAHNSTELQ